MILKNISLVFTQPTWIFLYIGHTLLTNWEFLDRIEKKDLKVDYIIFKRAQTCQASAKVSQAFIVAYLMGTCSLHSPSIWEKTEFCTYEEESWLPYTELPPVKLFDPLERSRWKNLLTELSSLVGRWDDAHQSKCPDYLNNGLEFQSFRYWKNLLVKNQVLVCSWHFP